MPEAVINKPGKLTDEEFDQIKIHPTSGYHTLKNIYDDKQIALGAKYHHERYDGKGYPNNLEGENIPEIAHSGEEGLRILKEKTMDLVLLDIVMPDMDGFEVFEKIYEIMNVPVVFMTADKNLKSIKKAAQMGVEDYVVKPFIPLVLKETVHGIVNHLS